MAITKIQLRRDYPDNWVSNNPILSPGEIGIEIPLENDTDNKVSKIKIGDGVTPWNDLDWSYYTKGETDKKFEEVSSLVNKLITNTELRFYCIKPVSVIVNGETTAYDANTLVYLALNINDTFEIIPSENDAIMSLTSYPGALDTFYEWLEGVNVFDGILFDMNSEDMYTKWNQGHQGQYRVQYAQYKNCIFWSDNPYISDVALRTNYTLYSTSELPLCYSTIPDNTFKSFYFAYNVTCDPNWSNPVYKESFAKATWATQAFSYYGLHSIGVFDMDSTEFNIVLPKDCRGLMFYAPNILNAGVFDAINTTNFGAKSGSWRDAFAYCYQLSNLYIKNLKVNLNVSWSPISQQALEFILSSAANTSSITISLSPFTWYRLTDSNRSLAQEKNISLECIPSNTADDNRLSALIIDGDGNGYLANDGTYKTITIPEIPTKVSAFENDSNYASSETVQQMIADNNANLHVYCTENDILRLFDESIPEEPVEPDTPVEPEIPTGNIGSITEDNSIVIDETQLENGTYTLRYIDSNENVIENFNEITSFEINK